MGTNLMETTQMTETQIIRMSQRADGKDVAQAEWDGRSFQETSRNGAIMAVARALCAAGRPEASWVGVDSRTGAERLQGASLSVLAGLTVSEPDRGRARIGTWTPHPRSMDAG